MSGQAMKEVLKVYLKFSQSVKIHRPEYIDISAAQI